MSNTNGSQASEDAAQIEKLRWNLAVANRILLRNKVVDAFGHVSQRSPLRSDRFYMASAIAPGSVTPKDIVEMDLDGELIDPTASPSYIERFIHSEIYRARPDVTSVIHSHSPSVIPFSVVSSVVFRCVCHTAGFLGDHTPVFEIRDAAGSGSDLLIRNSALGVALAKSLGDKMVVLMRGHGSTAVGSTLRQAVFHAVYAEVNARIQNDAARLGPITYLSADEGKAASLSDKDVGRAWDVWVSEVEKDLVA